MGGTVSRPSAG